MTVQPIREPEKIEAMKRELSKSGSRDYMLFVLGLNTGLRISDLLPLTVQDVRGTHIIKQEQKTGKAKRFLINGGLRQELDRYTAGMDSEAYLFPSQKGQLPISRVQAYRILNKAAEAVGLEEVGTHTMRKTFGYWHYKQHKDVALLQDIFNHSAPSVTLRYIGINDDIKDESLRDFFL